MKLLRGFLNFILSSILLVLIVSLSLIIRTKSFVEKELIVKIVKEGLVQGINNSNLTSEEKEIITGVINDKESETIIKKAAKNFINYYKNKDYNLNNDDYNSFLNYVIKYKDEFNLLNETDYTEKELKDILNYKDTNKKLKGAFADLYEDADRDVITNSLGIYEKITSFGIKKILFLAIIAVLILITIVNLNFYKWLNIAGNNLIISGILLGLIYFLGLTAINSIIKQDEALMIIKKIDLKGFLIMAFAEIAIGFLMNIGYRYAKKGNQIT